MNVPETPGYERSSSACQATPYGTSTSFAPNARMRSSFGGRRLDRDNGARHARGPRRVCDTLTGIAGADRPDPAPPFGFGQQRDGVGGAAQFVGVDRLEVLELEPHVGESRPELQANKRRANDGPGDTLAGVPDLAQRDGTDRFKHAAPAPRLPRPRSRRPQT